MKSKSYLPNSELQIMLIILEIRDKVSTTHIMNKVKNIKSVQLVQSYLKRLEEKNFIKVEKLGRLNFYIPLISLEEYRNQETNNFIDIFYQKSPTKLFTSLINNNQITCKELEELRKMIGDNN